MSADNFSRRQLFRGLLAALFGWLFLRRKEARADAKPPTPALPSPPAVSGGDGEMDAITTYSYNGGGELVHGPIIVRIPATASHVRYDASNHPTRWHYSGK